MSKEQIETAVRGGDVDKEVSKNTFGLKKSKYSRWPNGVVYYTLSKSVSKYCGSLLILLFPSSF